MDRAIADVQHISYILDRGMERNPKAISSWCMYDWANSAFATTIMAAVLPPYYGKVAGATLSGNLATVYWGYTNTISMLAIALFAPILGSIADHMGMKKGFLGFFALAGITASSSMYLIERGDWLLASFLFIVGEIGFSGSCIFYDSLLPHIAGPGDMDSVSSKGYALGYLGGGLLLALNLAWISFPELFGFRDSAVACRASFLSVGIWWALFSIPLFLYVPEPPADRRFAGINPISAGFLRLRDTFREVRRYREAMKFLVAFWLYNDGIGTIIKMATIYGSEIGIGQKELVGALLMTQFVGIPFTLLLGRIAGVIGAKRTVIISLIIYTLISIGGYFMSRAWHFFSLAFAVGIVQGGSQALSRSIFGKMIPKAKSAEFFGFYDVSLKFSGIFGPAIFALVGHISGSSRMSIVSLLFFFLGGALLLSKVRIPENA